MSDLLGSESRHRVSKGGLFLTGWCLIPLSWDLFKICHLPPLLQSVSPRHLIIHQVNLFIVNIFLHFRCSHFSRRFYVASEFGWVLGRGTVLLLSSTMFCSVFRQMHPQSCLSHAMVSSADLLSTFLIYMCISFLPLHCHFLKTALEQAQLPIDVFFTFLYPGTHACFHLVWI